MAEKRCKFWLPRKNRFCANAPLHDSLFCGNHKPRSDGQWVPCPIDQSHSVLKENLEAHITKCPLLKQTEFLSLQPFYQKGINAGKEEGEGVNDDMNITSEMKRSAVYEMSVPEFCRLIEKIESVHASMCSDLQDSYKMPEACNMWINREVDRKLPFQEKHVVQQASILGNLEDFGVLKSSVGRNHEGLNGDDGSCVLAVVEFGAGRGYLTQMLADCYGVQKVFMVERKSYKLKADRSLRQKESLILERLRIDIEDLNLDAVESLQGIPYLATGKHLCGPATDLTLRCCLSKPCNNYLKGLAIATCCHHLCQWKHYTNKNFMLNLGISKEKFHAITWFTSWAVDADHGSELSDVTDCRMHVHSRCLVPPLFSEEDQEQSFGHHEAVKDIIRNMKAVERAALGFKCKRIIDMGRLMWAKERGLDAKLVKYVPSGISPENHLLVAKCTGSR